MVELKIGEPKVKSWTGEAAETRPDRRPPDDSGGRFSGVPSGVLTTAPPPTTFRLFNPTFSHLVLRRFSFETAKFGAIVCPKTCQEAAILRDRLLWLKRNFTAIMAKTR